MSGRSCSLARRVFFEPIAGANEPTRQRSRVSLLAARRSVFGRRGRALAEIGLDDSRMPRDFRRGSLGDLAALMPQLDRLVEAETRIKTTGMPAETICRSALLELARAARLP